MAALAAVTHIMRSRSRRLGEDTAVSFGIATSTMKNGSRTRAVGEIVMRAGAVITRSTIAIKPAVSPRPWRKGPRRSEAKGPAPFGRTIELPRIFFYIILITLQR